MTKVYTVLNGEAKLSKRRFFVLCKLAFTDEIELLERKIWLPYHGHVSQVYPSLDGVDITYVVKELCRDRLVRFNHIKKTLYVTPKGVDALLENNF